MRASASAAEKAAWIWREMSSWVSRKRVASRARSWSGLGAFLRRSRVERAAGARKGDRVGVAFARKEERRARRRTGEGDDELERVVADPALEDGEGVHEGTGVDDADLARCWAVSVARRSPTWSSPAAASSSTTAARVVEARVAREGEGVDRLFELRDLVGEEGCAESFRLAVALR